MNFALLSAGLRGENSESKGELATHITFFSLFLLIPFPGDH